jgi:glycosyltransferase involved in cell wall biosynthesis
MKILLINNHGEPNDGASIIALMFRENLRQRGHDARLFASNASFANRSDGADYRCFGTHSGLQMLLQPANPSAYRQLRRALADFKPDVVHVRTFLWQMSPLILPLLRHVPSLYHVVSYKAICPLGTKMLPDGRSCEVSAGPACFQNGCLPLRIWPLMMLQQKLCRRWGHVFNLVVATSEAVRQRLMQERIDVAAVISEAIPRRSIRSRLSSPPTVAFAGRLIREKGADLLLRAFAIVVVRFPAARLLIAGDGPERENLKRIAVELRIASNVRFLGHISQAEMERLFEAAWLQIVPSRWAEPFGLVAAEAMMRGTAVIASSVGALAEFIRDGETGLLIAPGDYEALAGRMLCLMNDRELAEKMGRNGHDEALRRFDKNVYVDKFISLYEQLCYPTKQAEL